MNRETGVIVAVLLVSYALPAAGVLVAFDVGAGEPAPASNMTASPDDRSTSISFVERPLPTEYESVDRYNGTKSMMGNAGVYTADVDQDGWTDVLLVGGAEPRLLMNDNGTFRNSTVLPEIPGTARSALFVDYDVDGWPDLLVLTDEGAVLLENRRGTFAARPDEVELDLTAPIGATAGDYNGDGCPDLLVIQNGDWIAAHPAGEQNYSVPPGHDNGNPNYLLTGSCNGFEQPRLLPGKLARWSLAASFVDLTGDGRQDIHVANDFNRDVVYVTRSNGSFERIELGDRTNRNGMSSEVEDFDGDGRLDLFVTNIWYPKEINEVANDTMTLRATGNNLLLNRGNGTFEERADAYRVRVGGWGWAAVGADFDNDGDVDLLHATRTVSFRDLALTRPNIDAEDYQQSFYRYPAVWEWRNDRYHRISAERLGFVRSDGRGVAELDFDRDGDADLLIANNSGRFRLYENTGEGGNALQVVLKRSDRHTTLGARVNVTAGRVSRVQVRNAKADYLSQDSRTLHFGVGNNTRADIVVTWPDGTRTELTDVATGARLVVTDDGLVARHSFDDGL